MKLLYVVALAFQIELTSETSVDASKAGRRPKFELNGILSVGNIIRADPHHRRKLSRTIPEEVAET